MGVNKGKADISLLTIRDVDWRKLFALSVKHHQSVPDIREDLSGMVDACLEEMGHSANAKGTLGEYTSKLGLTLLYLERHGSRALDEAAGMDRQEDGWRY